MSLPNLIFEKPWATEKIIFIVEAYFRQKSIHAAQLQFKERFECREFPVHSMIYWWVNKFRTHCTVHNLNHKDTNRQSHSGRPKSSRTPHNLAAVRDFLVYSPSKSVRRRSQELGINRESVRIILIADLHMYLHRIQIKQNLAPDDMRKRVIMCQWFCDKMTLCLTLLTMSGFLTRHMFCSQVTKTLRTTSGVAHPLSSVCKGYYTLWSALRGLPSPNMSSLDHSGSRTTTSGLWQSTPSNTSRFLASSGQHLVDGVGSSGSSSGSSRMVPTPLFQKIIGIAAAAFPWPTDQPQVWPTVVAAFTGLEPPIFLYVGIP